MEKGEIWIVDFPSRKSREQSGTRPEIVISDTGTDLTLIIPLTSNLEALTKLPNTIKIQKTEENNLEKDSIALIFQLQALDKRRFISKIGDLEEAYLERINSILKKLLNL